MVGCMLQLRKLPWKWAWQDFFWPGCPERRLGTSCRCLALAQPKSAIESATMRTTRHSSGGGGAPSAAAPTTHQVTTAPSAQQATNPTALALHPPAYSPLHTEGYANSNYLPLRVDWVTYLNWFSWWGVGGGKGMPVSPTITTITGASRVLGLWLVSRTQHSQMSQSAFHCSLSWRIYDGYFTQNRLPLPGLSARIQIAVERAKNPAVNITNLTLLLAPGDEVP